MCISKLTCSALVVVVRLCVWLFSRASSAVATTTRMFFVATQRPNSIVPKPGIGWNVPGFSFLFFSSPVSFGNLFFRADYTARFARPERVGGGPEHCVFNGGRWRRCYSPDRLRRRHQGSGKRGAECRGVEWTRHGMERDARTKLS